MATTRLADIIEPQIFTNYLIANTMERTALVQSGVATRNSAIESQLRAGSHSFTVPIWHDLGNDEADIVNDDPNDLSSPASVNAFKQIVRKSFLHKSWSAMNLASEIAGDDAVKRIQSRVQAYWERQLQRRLIASLNGILASNVANDDSDMVHTVNGPFSAEAVIDAAGTLGDALENISAIAMHSAIYNRALKNDLIEFIPDSQGGVIKTFRGLAVILDDGLVPETGSSGDAESYTTVLFGANAVGYGMAAPTVAAATEIENLPSAGNGGGQQILHSRYNVAMHPAGFTWNEGTIAGESPSLSELGDASHWSRTLERKAINLAFLVTE